MKRFKEINKVIIEQDIIDGKSKSIILISKNNNNSEFGVNIDGNEYILDESFIIYLINKYDIKVYTKYKDSTTEVEVHGGHLRSRPNCSKGDNIENIPTH